MLAGALATQMSLPLSVVLELALLTALNNLMGRWKPRWRLSQPQLLLTYVVLAVGTAASGFWYTQALPTVAGYMTWFGTPATLGGPTLTPGIDLSSAVNVLPTWLIVKDRAALQAFYEGADETTSAAGYWHAWLYTMSFWVFFFAVFVGVVLCLSVLLRRQWSDRERLNFPLTQVPLAMTDPGTPLYRNRLLWIGIALAGSIDAINNLAMIYPAMPSLYTGYRDLASTLNTFGFPWSQIQWGAFGFSFYPFVVGLGFLMPLDMLFSFWFFYLFWNAIRLGVAALGYPYPGTGADAVFPYIPDQVQGGYLALGLMALWASRKDFRYALRQLLHREPPDPAYREAVSYPRALLGAVAGSLALVAMLTMAGSPWLVSAAFVAGFLIISVSIARLRAEFGAPFHDVEYNTPDIVLPKILGSECARPARWGCSRCRSGTPRRTSPTPCPTASRPCALAPSPAAATSARSSGRCCSPGSWACPSACWWCCTSATTSGTPAPKRWASATSGTGGTSPALTSSSPHPRRRTSPPRPASSSACSPAWGYKRCGCASRAGRSIRSPIASPARPPRAATGCRCSSPGCSRASSCAMAAGPAIRALPFFLGLVMGEAFVGAGWSIIGCLLKMPTYRYYYF